MKKIITLAILMASSNIYAGYSIIIDPKTVLGSDSAIVFKTKPSVTPTPEPTPTPTPTPTPEPTPEPATVCTFDATSYWLAGRNTAYNIIQVFHEGKTIKNGSGYNIRTIVVGNITYTRGVFAVKQGNYDRYYICLTKS